MGRRDSAVVAFVIAATVAACAAQPAGTAAARANGGQCFLASQVNGFSPVSDTVVDVKVGASQYYRLSLYGSCGQAAFANGVVLRRVGGGSSFICGAADAEIVVPGQVGLGERCLVQSISPIPEQQWIADRKKY